MNPIVFGLLARHVLTAIGGILVAQGIIDQSAVEGVTGALATLGGVVWSVIQKKKSGKL